MMNVAFRCRNGTVYAVYEEGRGRWVVDKDSGETKLEVNATGYTTSWLCSYTRHLDPIAVYAMGLHLCGIRHTVAHIFRAATLYMDERRHQRAYRDWEEETRVLNSILVRTQYASEGSCLALVSDWIMRWDNTTQYHHDEPETPHTCVALKCRRGKHRT